MDIDENGTYKGNGMIEMIKQRQRNLEPVYMGE